MNASVFWERLRVGGHSRSESRSHGDSPQLIQQKTLRRTVECSGITLHSGLQVRLKLHPARRDSGVTFLRSDLGAQLRLKKAKVLRADHATTLSGRDFTVGTVEHLLAALRILGIDNVVVELNGPEVPIMDGSASPFIYLVREAGIRRQAAKRRYYVLRNSIEIREDGREIAMYPADRLRVSYTIDFPGTYIGRQAYARTLTQQLLIDEIAPARTFCFLKEVSALRQRGLALGGSLENAIVVNETGPMNKLRFEDEFVRHKVLDLLGDLALLGMPIVGHVVATKAGHALHARLLEELRKPGVMEAVVRTRGEARFEPAVAAASA
jgi:UDP-3-O-[3-hydroxymyristoyl] N-acetylglucosamine deacetylase